MSQRAATLAATPEVRSAANAFLIHMVQQAIARGLHISLHTNNPGTTGASEVTGAGYARIATVWGAAAMNGADAQAQGADCSFTVPASTTVTHFGVWDAATAGNFQYGAALVPSVAINASGPGTVVVTPIYVERAG